MSEVYEVCKYCSEPKPLSEFRTITSRSGHNKGKSWKNANCLVCEPVYSKTKRDNRKKTNPEAVRRIDRRRHMKSKYGLSLKEFELLQEQQEGTCDVCNSPPRSKENLCVDHCHETERVRGLLCHSCNVALSRVKDDPAILRNLLQYLLKHHPEKK